MKTTKQAKAYKLNLSPIFDAKLADDYQQFFADNGIPSSAKSGATFDLCRSLPFSNSNFLGFTKDVLRNSYQSLLNTPVDLNHDRSIMIGSTIKSEIIEAEDDQPIIIRVCSAFWKDRLEYWGIENVADENGWSMECIFRDWSWYINGKILTRDECPREWDNKVDEILSGKPVYDDIGNRMTLLAGGSQPDSILEFNGLALVAWWDRPADSLSTETYLEVANQKGVDKMANIFSQEQVNEAKASERKVVESEFSSKITKLEGDLTQAQASISDKDSKIKELEGQLTEVNTKLAEANTKLTEVNGQVTELTEKVSKAEASIKEKEDNERFESRKSALASKGLSYREEKNDFIKTATDESFNDWVADLEAIASATTKTLQTKASELGFQGFASISLTGKGSESNEGDDPNKQTEKVNILF